MLLVKNPPANAGLRECKRSGFNPWVRKIPWRRAWQPTPVFLPGESLGQRSLAGYSPQGRRVGHDWRDLARTHACTQLINNVVTVSGGQQRDSAMYIHVSILPQTSLLIFYIYSPDVSVMEEIIGVIWPASGTSSFCSTTDRLVYSYIFKPMLSKCVHSVNNCG